MANLFELCGNTENLEKLNNISKEIKEKEILQKQEYHKRTHIFRTYEDALEYLKHHETSIEWHGKTLYWYPEKELFKAYEQEYDLDGVMCWDVVNYYTQEQLIEGVNNIKKKLKEKYNAGDEEFFDEFGFLEHVYI